MKNPTPASIARHRSPAHSFGRSLMMFTAGLVAASSLALTVARADSGCPPVDHGMVAAWGAAARKSITT